MEESQICLSWALCLWEINHAASITLWGHGYNGGLSTHL